MSKLRENPSRVPKHSKDPQCAEVVSVTKNDVKNFVKSKKENHSAKGDLVQLFICAVGICLSYLTYAFIHEHMSTSNFIKDHGPITSFIILTQSITNSIVAYIWMNIENKVFGKKSEQPTSTPQNGNKSNIKSTLNYRLLLAASFCYFAAMSATNESLNHVSYPTATLAKSSKLIPTMLMGVIVEKKSYSKHEWAGVTLITLGIIIFNFSRLKENKNISSSAKQDSPFGIALLSLSLVMDGFLGSCQSMLKSPKSNPKSEKSLTPVTQFRVPTAIETMLYINLFSILFLLPTACLSNQFSNAISILIPSELSQDALGARTTAAKFIFLLNLCAASGQIFIFFTIHLFSPIICTTITTTRKFFTILLSVCRFGHVFNFIQWSSIFMVFGGLYLEITNKLNEKKTTKLQQKED